MEKQPSIVLKVICTNNKDINQSNTELIHCPGLYLTGNIETTLGYDLVYCLNSEDEVPRENIGGIYNKINLEKGIYPCEVVGYPKDCVALIWHRKIGDTIESCGYIIDLDDKERLTRLKEKYDENSIML